MHGVAVFLEDNAALRRGWTPSVRCDGVNWVKPNIFAEVAVYTRRVLPIVRREAARLVMPHISQRFSPTVEILESRIALSASPLGVGRALDLNDSITVILSGDPLSFGTKNLGATGQLLGFPSGGDGDFLILSTGIASQVTTLADAGPDDPQGTDLGAAGATGDTASVSFSLPVPAGPSGKRLKIDFMFLSEEYPAFVGADFNDTFEILINGVNYAKDEFNNLVEVDNVYFTGENAPGTFFNGRSSKLTMTYVVPDGVTDLNVVLRLTDVGDGEVDSAVLVDNVRFESPQRVFLDFDGATIANHFGAGIVANIPAFSATDLGLTADMTDALIASLAEKLSAKYAAYDIEFVTTEPTSGEYTTLIIGGDDSLLLDIAGANPLLTHANPGSSIAISTLFQLGSEKLLGYAGAPDVGNLNHSDKAVIFSGEFGNDAGDIFAALTPEERVDHLVVTLAHELGHNLGLRHVTDANSGDIMKQTAPRAIDAIFGSTLVSLAEAWSDGASLQNDNAYLSSVLGKVNGTGLSESFTQNTTYFSTGGHAPLFNVTLTITSGDPDSAPITLHFDQLNGSQNIPLPLLPKDAKISITAASVLGGAIDTFTGTPASGALAYEASAVPLFAEDGSLKSLPLAKGTPGTLATNGTLALTVNDLGDVTLLPGKTGTFTDSDGDIYTIKLTGPGVMGYVLDDPDHDGHGGLARLVLDDTTVGLSALTVTVKKAKTGDGLVNFGTLLGTEGAGLKTLTAAAVSFNDGGIDFATGALGSVTVRDLLNGSNIIGGAAALVKTNLTIHALGDNSTISLGTEIATFKAAWLGNASITAVALAKLTVSGDRALNLPGNIGAQFEIPGLIGSITGYDLLSTAQINGGGSVIDRTTLAFHEIANGAVIDLADTLTSLKAARIGEATLHASRVDTIAVTGDVDNFIPGNFGADLTVSSKIGKLTARDILATASIVAGGEAFEKTSLTVHAIADGAVIDIESGFSTFKAADVGAATIHASAIATLQITGDLKAWLAGDFRAQLTLDGGDMFFANILTSATIKGNVRGAAIVTESIGTFNALGVLNSTIYAGFTPTDPASPLNGGMLLGGTGIKSLTVGAGGFANSFVAGVTIGTIKIGALGSLNGGTPFGLLTHVAPTKVTITGFNYVKGGPADQVQGDFHLKVV
jgi:hypothetical protein